MKLYPLVVEEWQVDGGVAYSVIPKSLWSKVYPCNEDNLIPMVNRILLVQAPGALVLIDTGFGNKRDEKYYRYKYISMRISVEDALRSVGFDAADVTDVLFTHLHDDHVGGAVERVGDEYRLVFPNATHWVSEKHYRWAENPNPREAASFFGENLRAIEDANALRLVREPGEVLPGIEVLFSDGHTGGQMIPLIRTEKGVVAYPADFIPSSIHIPLHYLASVDIQPLVAMSEKMAFLRKAVDEQYILVFEHDYFTEACRVNETEKGFVASGSFTLSELFN